MRTYLMGFQTEIYGLLIFILNINHINWYVNLQLIHVQYMEPQKSRKASEATKRRKVKVTSG